MDDIVRQALAKWPNVPHCTGWLLLDRRGEWRLRDDAAQAAGELGSPIRHAALNAFIGRNYECDAQGQWFFQNGPQRVYVDLEAAPWVWRVQGGADPVVHSHTGRAAQVSGAWVDEHGRLFLQADIGLGLVHSLDMEAASDALEAGLWTLKEARFDELPARFGYCLRPRPQPKTPEE